MLKLAGAALNQTPLDWSNNVENIKNAIREAKDQQVDILCLPELCITGYGCEDLFLSNWLPEKAFHYLLAIIEDCKGITVCIGLPIRHKGNLYNCACLIEDGEILGLSAKQFLANDGIHYEPRWFTSWKANEEDVYIHQNKSYRVGDITYEVKGVKVGFEICEDAWREGRPACRLQQRGVQLILNPSASHFAFAKSKFRENLVVTSSSTFDCVYLYANLLGNETGRAIYDGEIYIAQKGKLIQRNARLSFQNVNLATAKIDFEDPANSHASIAQDDQDKNLEFVKAVTLGLFDYMRKSRSNGFVLSLSGGADSSACAVLVAEMTRRATTELGYEGFLEKIRLQQHINNVSAIQDEKSRQRYITRLLLTCAYQATRNSSSDTFNSAKLLADSIGAVFYKWQIDEEVNSYTAKIEKVLNRKLEWATDDIALQNIQARARSPIIWMLANITKGLLITTSNRSEGDVGYATMDGDTSGSIAPIAGVDKFFLLNWLKWAEKDLNYEGLKFVNNLSPSAELRPPEKDQTDEKDLMPYSIIVQIERLAIREHRSPAEVYLALKEKGLEPDHLLKLHIEKFFRMWSINQWKRERIAPSFHLDDFNVDPKTWCRFPILSGSFEEELKELKSL